MTPQLWIAVGFTGALVLFLMITFFIRDRSTATQYNTLRFLTALCAGFAGGFFAGDALFRYNQNVSAGVNVAISGTAGFALMFVIWLSYPKRAEEKIPPDRIILSIPEGWTFEQAARGIVKAVRAVIVFEGFQKSQLSVKLPSVDIDAPNASAALLQLRYQSDKLPEYRVDLESGVFHVRA